MLSPTTLLHNMAYAKRFTKGSRMASRDKYSVETYSTIYTIPTGTPQGAIAAQFTLVPATDDKGMRKVKHLTLNLAPFKLDSAGDDSTVFGWAILYLPEGVTLPAMNWVGGTAPEDLIACNQFVMDSGYCRDDEITRIRSRMSRNLNSGDSIILVIGAIQNVNENTTFPVQFRYAISYS